MKQRRRSKVAGELRLPFGIGYEIRDRFNEAQKRGKIGGAPKWPQFKMKLNKSYVGRFFWPTTKSANTRKQCVAVG